MADWQEEDVESEYMTIESLEMPQPDEWLRPVEGVGKFFYSVLSRGRGRTLLSLHDVIEASIVNVGPIWEQTDIVKQVHLLPAATTPFERYPELEAEIIRARELILGLGDNWDDEGSPGYNERTFQLAAEFARDLVSQTTTEFSCSLIVPTIGPAAAGSIDVYWKATAVTLLVNVPALVNTHADPNTLATYSGRRETGETTNGRVSINERRFGYLAAWLAGTR